MIKVVLSMVCLGINVILNVLWIVRIEFVIYKMVFVRYVNLVGKDNFVILVRNNDVNKYCNIKWLWGYYVLFMLKYYNCL